MDATAIELPAPSRHHATCAWCRRTFVTIEELIDHIDAGHLPSATRQAERERRSPPPAASVVTVEIPVPK